jgi:hypothetical protein
MYTLPCLQLDNARRFTPLPANLCYPLLNTFFQNVHGAAPITDGATHAHCAAPVTTCAGSTKVALYPGQALNYADAGAFCKQALGPSAGLAPGSPAVLAAAQGLVQQAQVGKGHSLSPALGGQ